MATVPSMDFVKEIQKLVRAKHSKNHPIIGMIEDGKLDREALKGFVGQFYLFFPKPFPKPIATVPRVWPAFTAYFWPRPQC